MINVIQLNDIGKHSVELNAITKIRRNLVAFQFGHNEVTNKRTFWQTITLQPDESITRRVVDSEEFYIHLCLKPVGDISFRYETIADAEYDLEQLLSESHAGEREQTKTVERWSSIYSL